jgi:hypothetical protein
MVFPGVALFSGRWSPAEAKHDLPHDVEVTNTLTNLNQILTMSPLLDILTLRFTVERSADGGYVGSCLELNARLEAADMPKLEQEMSSFARALGGESAASPPMVLIRRRFPAARAVA